MTLERRTPLKRTGRLSPVGKKARTDRKELDAIRPEIVDRGCEFAEATRLSSSYYPQCRGELVVHHRKRRGQGGTNEADNLVCLCDRHHRLVHDDIPMAKAYGLLA